MVYVADVIEEQLRGLDEAKKAKLKVPVSAPDPVPACRQPMLEGDRRREAIRARNQEALQRLEAQIKERLH